MAKNINEELLDDSPDDLAVEFSEEAQYAPDQNSQVVITEPKIISVGRGKRREAVRKMQQESGQSQRGD